MEFVREKLLGKTKETYEEACRIDTAYQKKQGRKRMQKHLKDGKLRARSDYSKEASRLKANLKSSKLTSLSFLIYYLF